jgi:hypothetical protein
MSHRDPEPKVPRGRLSRFLDLLPRSRPVGRPDELALLSGGWRAASKRMQQQSSGCGWAFSGLFFLMGCASLVMLVWVFLLLDWRANNRYLPNSCVVLDRRLASTMSEPGPEGGTPRPVYHPEIKIRYEVGGRKYEVWTYDAIAMFYPNKAAQQAIVDNFQVGANYPCWYDPDRPEKAILVRGHAWAPYVLLIVPIGFLVIGGIGIRHSWQNRTKTAHRRGLGPAPRAGQAMPGTDPDRPGVPVLDLSQSPGRTLPYRLPSSTRPSRNLLGCLFFTLFWNGITAPFVVIVFASHRGWGGVAGIGKWIMTLGITPFVLVGLMLIGLLITAAVKEVLVALAVGPTTVEASAHPLIPGECCELLLSQSGRRALKMNSFTVLCICEEEAKGGQGENRKATTRRVFEEAIIAQVGFEVQADRPFEVRGDLRVPPGAMHSFLAVYNEVRWKLVVRGDVAGWPNFERAFPIIVQPAKGAPK